MAALGNIQRRSNETETEKKWRLFGEQLRKEQGKSFSFKKGTSDESGNGKEQHEYARYETFDFEFKFINWDSQTYDNIPNYRKGKFTGDLKDWMWDYQFKLNIEVKEVGRGNFYSVMPNRFCDAFNISRKKEERNKWLIVDFSNVLKLSNHGGIIYVKEVNETTTHHIFHHDNIHEACIGGYHVDWEGDPTPVGGGAYKAKTLLHKDYSIKFDSFEEVQDYIRSMAECKLWQQKEKNRRLFHKNIKHKKTYILPFSDGKLKYAKQDPVVFQEGLLNPAPQKQIVCEEVAINE